MRNNEIIRNEWQKKFETTENKDIREGKKSTLGMSNQENSVLQIQICEKGKNGGSVQPHL